MSLALELIDFGDHLVERRVHGVLTGVRQVRQVRFGRHAGDVELRDDRADGVEGAARVFDRGVERVGAGAQGNDGFAGGHDRLPQRVQLPHVHVELHLACGDRRAQLLDAALCIVELQRQRG